MSDALKAIAVEFEAAALRAVSDGGDASDIERAADEAYDRLRALKAGAADELLEAIFAAVLEIKAKADMAIEAARK